MAIPLHLQGFKAAGIYRVLFDKSTIINQDTNILRLVVGYSEVGPFNTPVYVNNATDFVQLFGGISKKLEKRGIYFHRLALQMLSAGPILALNLKKFKNECVGASTISTNINPTFDPIDTVKLNVEDIYDTSRFWTLDASQLNDLRSVEGTVLDQYINISTTGTKKTSASYFIRKASGYKTSSFNMTLDTWYSDGIEQMPEYLENQRHNKVSDYFAEVYVFSGEFTPDRVMASETLKNYFNVKTVNNKRVLELKPYILDAYGEAVDTLDALYYDETSGSLGHYTGSLIPYFKDKQGKYVSLDILFNTDLNIHNMMMSFNTNGLEENKFSIDLSGNSYINESDLFKIFNGKYTTKLMGNVDAPVVAAVYDYSVNVVKNGAAIKPLVNKPSKINGTLYVSSVALSKKDKEVEQDGNTLTVQTNICTITLSQVLDSRVVEFNFDLGTDDTNIKTAVETVLTPFKVEVTGDSVDNFVFNGETYYENEVDEDGNTVGAFANDSLNGPKKVITSIGRVEQDADTAIYTDAQGDFKLSFMQVSVESITANTLENNVYNPSVSFVKIAEDWSYDTAKVDGFEINAFVCKHNSALSSVLSKGDILLSPDDTNLIQVGENMQGDTDEFCDNTIVQGSGIDDNGLYYVAVPNEPAVFTAKFKLNTDTNVYEPIDNNYVVTENDVIISTDYIVRVDNPLNQEIGVMRPVYLEGYIYENDKPNGIDMYSKQEWQDFILSTLTDYKGLRTGLLDKAEIDYRYVVDTFESFVTDNLKSVLSYMCLEKQSAFCIANFPSVQTFIKCPYASFTNSNGVFDVQYIVDGCNKNKVASKRFSIPSEADGASFMAFYTPLKFSDGYVDTVIPSAGLVSNLFINKYYGRQPYYIVAGPNYGKINASGLVGPDYKYTMSELQIIEPFGINCMVYRPTFGTFINANQTAKQTPVSALSKVNVRELVIYLQDEIEKVLQSYQWEFNNKNTRSAILSRANSICANVQANGGLVNYKNVMDDSNNTQEIIDNEMAVLSTYIEPGMGCGKMVHELTIYRSGQMKSSITS